MSVLPISLLPYPGILGPFPKQPRVVKPPPYTPNIPDVLKPPSHRTPTPYIPDIPLIPTTPPPYPRESLLFL